MVIDVSVQSQHNTSTMVTHNHTKGLIHRLDISRRSYFVSLSSKVSRKSCRTRNTSLRKRFDSTHLHKGLNAKLEVDYNRGRVRTGVYSSSVTPGSNRSSSKTGTKENDLRRSKRLLGNELADMSLSQCVSNYLVGNLHNTSQYAHEFTYEVV